MLKEALDSVAGTLRGQHRPIGIVFLKPQAGLAEV